MSFNTAFRFFNILVFKQKGQVPTVPVLLNIDQQNKLWKQATDLNDGEYCINNIDKLIYFRMGSQILTFNLVQLPNVIELAHQRLHALNSVLDHTSTIPQGNLMDADENGLPHNSGVQSSSISCDSNSGIKYNIEEGETVIVNNNHQYFLKDHLYLNGGTIQLNGSAQLILD